MILQEQFHRIGEMDRDANISGSDRKEGGVTYTPPEIAIHMVRTLSPKWDWDILEPSCGRGTFAFALIEYWLENGKTWGEVAAWAEKHLHLCDIDAEAVADMLSLWSQTFSAAGAPCRPASAKVADGLFGHADGKRYDAIIGNPPYVRTQNLDGEYLKKIRRTFPSCAQGNVDLYFAFIEDALNRADHVCYITPSSWMSNRSGENLRKKAISRIESITDFGTSLVFSPVRAYTSIFSFGSGNRHVMVRKASFGGELNFGEWEQVARNDARWDHREGWTPHHAKISSGGGTLSTVAKVFSGIATLADSAYILPSPTTETDGDGNVWVIQDDPLFHGITARIPEHLAPPLIKATRPDSEKRIICPYDDAWNVIPEEHLRKMAPDALAWLERRRNDLDKRDKGKTSGYPAWYAYGRRQGFWTPPEGEFLMVPQMGNGKLTVHKVKGGRRILFTSGYAVVPFDSKNTTAIADGIRSAEAWNFVRQYGKGWAGKGEYITIGAPAIRNLPVGDLTPP